MESKRNVREVARRAQEQRRGDDMSGRRRGDRSGNRIESSDDNDDGNGGTGGRHIGGSGHLSLKRKDTKNPKMLVK